MNPPPVENQPEKMEDKKPNPPQNPIHPPPVPQQSAPRYPQSTSNEQFSKLSFQQGGGIELSGLQQGNRPSDDDGATERALKEWWETCANPENFATPQSSAEGQIVQSNVQQNLAPPVYQYHPSAPIPIHSGVAGPMRSPAGGGMGHLPGQRSPSPYARPSHPSRGEPTTDGMHLMPQNASNHGISIASDYWTTSQHDYCGNPVGSHQVDLKKALSLPQLYMNASNTDLSSWGFRSQPMYCDSPGMGDQFEGDTHHDPMIQTSRWNDPQNSEILGFRNHPIYPPLPKFDSTTQRQMSSNSEEQISGLPVKDYLNATYPRPSSSYAKNRPIRIARNERLMQERSEECDRFIEKLDKPLPMGVTKNTVKLPELYQKWADIPKHAYRKLNLRDTIGVNNGDLVVAVLKEAVNKDEEMDAVCRRLVNFLKDDERDKMLEYSVQMKQKWAKIKKTIGVSSRKGSESSK
ncbi:hypothetical protein GCK72_012712 [Caenorhabditis remanei]|uniref:Uncharacterized protein n=1 Tax=Caenorhabditis remanei TaxID=31234 RepID=A0A6A5GP52_CAERE|nr:hypothetical protein GCK72_012712 [Caenorhabditis remanei]KAF1756259.1 hypothetical protein GCK72_012712 [Caenorhabditis remanei]